MLLSPFLTVSALVGLALATINEEYCAACKVVETAISNASNVYYPGENEQLPRWKPELMHGQATPCISKESTTLPHPVIKILRAWSNLAHRGT